MKKFRFACTGGTFDRTHKGHETLLRKAFATAQKVLIGITSDAFVRKNKKFSQIVKPYAQRKKELEAWLKKHGFRKKAVLAKLNDVYGPTAVKTNAFDCIVTSRKTISGAMAINKKRSKNRLAQLPIILVKTIGSEDAKPISSTRIRQGQTDRQGRVFERAFSTTLHLTQKTMRIMKRPFGKLVRTEKAFQELRKLKPFKIIVVGDASAMVFEKAPSALKPSAVVVDGMIGRKKVSFTPTGKFDKIVRVANRHSTITPKAAKTMERAVEINNHKRVLVLVKGEEDLLALPAYLFAPLDSVVCYGQPGKGMVLVKVTEEKKRDALRIAERMKR